MTRLSLSLLILLGVGLDSVGVLPCVADSSTPTQKTAVSIVGDSFYINGIPTYSGRTWQGHKIEGLLLNSRMVQGIFDDLNPATVSQWNYPDTGKWDAERNTREFIAAMPEWRRHGLLAFTINLQGGSPYGYSSAQPWENSAFASDGSLRPEYMSRLERILDRADELGMVAIVGYFYFGQDGRLKDDNAVINACDNATKWLLDHKWRNVLVEINNECSGGYHQAILKPKRVHELMERVRGQGFLVSTSYPPGRIPDENVARAADFLLVHGNGVSPPERIDEMVGKIRAVPGAGSKPIIFNEDDHYAFDHPMNNFVAAVSDHVSWGYFDFRRKGDSLENGYQSVPVDWGIDSPRKKGFFSLLGQITGSDSTQNSEPATPAAATSVVTNSATTTTASTSIAITGPGDAKWSVIATTGLFHPREECSFVECGGQFYLLGGRGIKPVDILIPKTQTWTQGAAPPIEVHHFQPVVWQNRIYIACAMTGGFPKERPLEKILIYDPQKNEWSWGDEIRPLRRRGSAGAVVRDDKLYVVCGIVNGHTDGWVNIFDSYDFKTGVWTVLPDAPRTRDHFGAAIIGDKLYLAGGRRSSFITHQLFDLTIPEVDVYDFQSEIWQTLPESSNLPTLRAGAGVVAAGADLILVGGESMEHLTAHTEVDAFDTTRQEWRALPPLSAGRHGTGVIYFDGTFYTCAGAGNRGGSPLVTSLEALKFP